jgi:hypothetical protein
VIEGSGSIPLTIGSGSRRPKNIRIRRIWILNTVLQNLDSCLDSGYFGREKRKKLTLGRKKGDIFVSKMPYLVSFRSHRMTSRHEKLLSSRENTYTHFFPVWVTIVCFPESGFRFRVHWQWPYGILTDINYGSVHPLLIMLFLGFLPELGAERCQPEEKQDPQPDQGVLRGQGTFDV